MPDSPAQTRLKGMTAAATTPALSDDEIDELLVQFAKVDKDGLAPDDEDWTPTYNYRAAAAEGWRRKAGKASELQSTDLDGDRMSANQVFDHCREMIKVYAGSVSAVIPTTTSTSDGTTG